MSNNEITKKLREIKELQQIIDEATAEAESLKDEIKAFMIGSNLTELTADVFKVRYTQINSNRFDSSAFKKDNAELYAQYTKLTTSMRFTIA